MLVTPLPLKLGERIQRSTGTVDKIAAQEYHDKLKAELWNITKLANKPVYSWRDAVLRWLKLAIINDSDYRKKVITRQLRIKPLSPLSSRELQCLSLISQGFKIKEVADKLHLSIETVNTHAKSIRQKLACKNITEAVTKAFSLRIL